MTFWGNNLLDYAVLAGSQVARALGVADSKEEGASLPGSPKAMGANASSPTAADADGQQPPAHHLQLPAPAVQVSSMT